MRAVVTLTRRQFTHIKQYMSIEQHTLFDLDLFWTAFCKQTAQIC